MSNNKTMINGRSPVTRQSGGVVVTSPDVCLTPSSSGPVPVIYANSAKSADLVKGSKTVRIQGAPVCLKDSFFVRSTGDERGTAGGGVISGTIKGKADPVTWSGNVFIEGRPVVRNGDLFTGNNRNTPPGPIQQQQLSPDEAKPPERLANISLLIRYPGEAALTDFWIYTPSVDHARIPLPISLAIKGQQEGAAVAIDGSCNRFREQPGTTAHFKLGEDVNALETSMKETLSNMKTLLNEIVELERGLKQLEDSKYEHTPLSNHNGIYTGGLLAGAGNQTLGILHYTEDASATSEDVRAGLAEHVKALDSAWLELSKGQLRKYKYSRRPTDTLPLARLMGALPEDVSVVMIAAYDIAVFLINDAPTKAVLTKFCNQYAQAQARIDVSSIRDTELFDIIFASLIAAKIPDAGDAPYVKVRIRHRARFRDLSVLLLRQYERIKRRLFCREVTVTAGAPVTEYFEYPPSLNLESSPQSFASAQPTPSIETPEADNNDSTESDTAVTQHAQEPPVETTRSTPDVKLDEINLCYQDATGEGIADTQYTVEDADGNTLYQGVLDGLGQTKITGVTPDKTHFYYRFSQDPIPFEPKIQPIAHPGMLEEASNALGAVGRWVWGTAQGDFNQDQSTGQLAVNTIIGLIPIADQVLDVRDIIAGIVHLSAYYNEDDATQAKHPDLLGLSHETWLWVGVFLIALGCIPTLGSAIKGVLKTLIKKVKALADSAGKLTPRQIELIWEELVGVLNYFGKGNAHQWLKELQTNLPKWMDQASETIRGAMDVLKDFLGKLDDLSNSWVGKKLLKEEAAAISKKVKALKQSLTTMYDRLEVMKGEINQWFGDLIGRILKGRPDTRTPGVAGSSMNQVQQEVRAPVKSDPEFDSIDDSLEGGFKSRDEIDRSESGEGLGHDGLASSTDKPKSVRKQMLALTQEEQELVKNYKAGFKPHGVAKDEALDYILNTQAGHEHLRQAKLGDPSATDKVILERVLEQVESGSALPVKKEISSSLVKIVPSSRTSAGYGPYFTTPEQLDNAHLSGESLSNLFGLPGGSDAESYRVFEIQPKGTAVIFESTIAPTVELEGKIRTTGGAKQLLVPNRSQFNDPVDIGTLQDNFD